MLEEHVKASDARIGDEVRSAEAMFAKCGRCARAVLTDCPLLNGSVLVHAVWAILDKNGTREVRVAHLREEENERGCVVKFDKYALVLPGCQPLVISPAGLGFGIWAG